MFCYTCIVYQFNLLSPTPNCPCVQKINWVGVVSSNYRFVELIYIIQQVVVSANLCANKESGAATTLFCLNHLFVSFFTSRLFIWFCSIILTYLLLIIYCLYIQTQCLIFFFFNDIVDSLVLRIRYDFLLIIARST